MAARHGATPHEVALAWLGDLHDCVTALPGVTRLETVRSAASARRIQFTEEDRELLDERFPSGRVLRRGPQHRAPSPWRTDAEVVMVMGLPAAGKTTLTRALADAGYQRLNRDQAGGSLTAIAAQMRRVLDAGPARIVLDNTYLTRRSRAAVLRAASDAGVPVHCKWLATDLDNAQVNAITRLITKYGKLPDEVELAALRKKDVNAFPPTVLFRYQRELEPPDPSEGFTSIERVNFERHPAPGHVNRAVIAWCDTAAALLRSATVLRDYAAAGWKLIVLSWQPDVAARKLTVRDVERSFGEVRDALGVEFDLAFCPHGAGPPRCWCRKPLPGLGVLMMQRHQIDPARSIYVGDGPQDAGFARKLGIAAHLAKLGDDRLPS